MKNRQTRGSVRESVSREQSGEQQEGTWRPPLTSINSGKYNTNLPGRIYPLLQKQHEDYGDEQALTGFETCRLGGRSCPALWPGRSQALGAIPTAVVLIKAHIAKVPSEEGAEEM